ncbi:Telomere length regulation protein elg1 [Leucoagaricus sp. SymC.cos]|nr:Telomere length regulation protein elg1 [Leucoagaricus sp. SymC.cos]
MSDDKRKSTTSKPKSKAAKSGIEYLPREEGDPQSEATVIPNSIDTTDTNDALVTLPKQQSAATPTFEDRSNIESALANIAFIEFSDSDTDINTIPNTILSSASSQGSRDAPIYVDSSPVKPTHDPIEELKPNPTPVSKLELKKKPLHPFFAPRGKSITKTATPALPELHRTKDTEAIYPNCESQHVKGVQTLYPFPPCPFARRHVNINTMVGPALSHRGNHQAQWDNDTPVLNFLLPQKIEEEDPYNGLTWRTTDDVKIHAESIEPSLVREHPAIERVVDAAKAGAGSSSSGQLWVDAWHPRCAKEVLGNEHSAIYLRNWLHTLAIQLNPVGSEDENLKKKRKKKVKKRPRVVREVPRKKPRRDGLDGFLAEDDEEDDAYPIMDHDDDLDGSSQRSGLDETGTSVFASDAAEAINEQLHNTILLTGPPGTGKTAAVFACAEELGWEVFEVYPGIGRRNGANVDNLVGEVGKNHLVRKKTGATGQVSIATLLSNNAGAGEENEDWASSGEGSSEEFRQSLILLEEVDVLFKDDVNFWSAVTNLIKECRRPVICTCNDASLVPMDELPLQKVLYFEPCAPAIGTAYLQGLAMAEGYTVAREILWQVYCETYELAGTDVPHETSPATGHLELPEYDLRRAIHGVQMGCTTGGRWGAKNSAEYGEGSRDWAWEISHEGANDRCRNMREMDAISQQAELVSYTDGLGVREEWGGEEVSQANQEDGQ